MWVGYKLVKQHFTLDKCQFKSMLVGSLGYSLWIK